MVTRWYRPPELLLGATRYGAEVDMWSCGCVLAEMLMGRPLLPGNDEADQIDLIFRTCGSPTEATWPGASALPFYDMFRPEVPMRRMLREALGHGLANDAVDLVDRLLTLDPARRLSADGMLRHDYFRRPPAPCPPGSLPRYEPCHELQMKRRRAEAKAAAEAEAAAAAAARRAAEEEARAAERRSTPLRGSAAPPDCMLRVTPPRGGTPRHATPPPPPPPPLPPPPPPPYGSWPQQSRAAGMGFGAQPPPPLPPYGHHPGPYGYGHHGHHAPYPPPPHHGGYGWHPPPGAYGAYPPPPPGPPPGAYGYAGAGPSYGGFGAGPGGGAGAWGGEPPPLSGDARFYAQALAREAPRIAARPARRGPRPATAPVPLYSAATLAASPSCAAGISAADEAAYRGLFAAFLRDMRRTMRLPSAVMATAAVFGLRFYAQHSYGEYANRPHIIGAACLLLAAKVEGAPKLVADVAAASYALRYRGADLHSDGHKHGYPRERENILEAERRVVRAIGFQFAAKHALDEIILARSRLITLADQLASPARDAAPPVPPSSTPAGRLSPMSPARSGGDVGEGGAAAAGPSFPAPPKVAFDARALAQAAMTFANDSFATTLPLQYDAVVLAGAFLQLAAALTGAPLGPEHLEWALRASLPLPALRDVAEQVCAVFRAAGQAAVADRIAESLGLEGGAPPPPPPPNAHGSPLSEAEAPEEGEVAVEAVAGAAEAAAPPPPPPEEDAAAQEAAKRQREEDEAERLAMLAPQRRLKREN